MLGELFDLREASFKEIVSSVFDGEVGNNCSFGKVEGKNNGLEGLWGSWRVKFSFLLGSLNEEFEDLRSFKATAFIFINSLFRLFHCNVGCGRRK